MLHANPAQTVVPKKLILGDSLVAGEGATNNLGWAQTVAKKVNAVTIGVPGATSREILSHLPTEPFDQVIVQIGTNDARFRHAKNATETSQEEFSENLTKIVSHFQMIQPNVELIFVDLLFVEEQRTVLYRPDRSYFARDLRVAATVLRNFCAEGSHSLISLEALSRQPERLADGLHPAQSLHDEVADHVCDFLLNY